MRSKGDKIHVQALVAAAKRTQTFAPQILKINTPTLFRWQIGCKIVLSTGRPLTNLCNVVPHFNRKNVYVLRIPRIIMASPCRSRGGRKLPTQSQSKSKQKDFDPHFGYRPFSFLTGRYLTDAPNIRPAS